MCSTVSGSATFLEVVHVSIVANVQDHELYTGRAERAPVPPGNMMHVGKDTARGA